MKSKKVLSKYFLFFSIGIFSFAFGEEFAFIKAIKAKDINAALKEITIGKFEDYPDSYGLTGMMYAASSGVNEVLSALIKSGKGRIDYQDTEGRTALILAVLSQNTNGIKILLTAGANPLLKSKEMKTALDYASVSPDLLNIFARKKTEEPVLKANTIPELKLSMADYADRIHNLELETQAAKLWAYSTDKKVTGLALNLILPSLGSWVIGDIAGGVVTCLLIGGVIVEILVNAPLTLTIVTATAMEVLNISFPIIYGEYVRTSGVVVATF